MGRGNGEIEEKNGKRLIMRPFSKEKPMRNPLVILHGEREAIVYGCRRILSYGGVEIRLCVGKKQLRITGRGLYCSSFSGNAVTVVGEIQDIGYEALSGGVMRRSE